MLDVEELHDFATSLAIKAGDALRSAAFARMLGGATLLQSQDKQGGSTDIVTQVDEDVEALVVEAIRQRYPEHDIVAEECYSKGGGAAFKIDESKPSWIVDPLDGTVNFLHLFPLVCVSIGLIHQGQTLVGAIYAPLLGSLDPSAGGGGTLWSSARGRGAYQSYPVHGRPESSNLAFLSGVSKQDGLPRPQRLPLTPQPLPADTRDLLFASEWGKDRRERPGGNLERKSNTFINLASEKSGRQGRGAHVQGMRSLGSSALDFAFCAAGSFDVVWEGAAWEWDVCAGIAILLEAGGLVTDSNPPPADSPFWKPRSESGVALPQASLGGRRFLAVRSGLAGETESVVEAQERIVREIWRRTDGLDYRREGVEYPIEAQPWQ